MKSVNFATGPDRLKKTLRVIHVNHEFGYPYDGIAQLREKGIPIIEDCAHSFFSKDESNIIGTVGEFAIYSFPKIFPLQIGGLLVCNLNNKLPETNLLGKTEKQYIKNVLSYYIPNQG